VRAPVQIPSQIRNERVVGYWEDIIFPDFVSQFRRQFRERLKCSIFVRLSNLLLEYLGST
jgi:hypothetical protein